MAGTFLILLFLSVPLLVIWHYVSLHKKNKILMAEMEQPVILPAADSVYATVLEKDVVMLKSQDSKYGGHSLVYKVKFLVDHNEAVEYSVPEELFEFIYTGQKGILATIDGEFFDFGEGEDIE